METRLHHYVCIGAVRGECGHHHRTVESATVCVLQDKHNCRAQGGYSDRIVEGRDAKGQPVELDEDGNEATE